jgi:Na+/glutamate symporter
MSRKQFLIEAAIVAFLLWMLGAFGVVAEFLGHDWYEAYNFFWHCGY